MQYTSKKLYLKIELYTRVYCSCWYNWRNKVISNVCTSLNSWCLHEIQQKHNFLKLIKTVAYFAGFFIFCAICWFYDSILNEITCIKKLLCSNYEKFYSLMLNSICAWLKYGLSFSVFRLLYCFSANKSDRFFC